jgi:serine phosphatase RsbU (regulator of sigma subunit)
MISASAWGRQRINEAPERLRYALQCVAVVAAYTVSGKLGLEFAYASHSVTAIWPPTGIALAALTLGGFRLWPAVALGALLTNLDTGAPALTVVGITCGNTLEALAGAYLLRRAGFDPALRRVRDVLYLVFFAAVISTTISATVGVGSLLAGGAIEAGHAAATWRLWWLGDAGGDLLVAPAVFVAVAYRYFRDLPGRWYEALALGLALVALSVLVFSRPTGLAYFVFPLLTWAALRFWQPGAAAASLIVGAVAVGFTAHGQGPFAMHGPDDRLVLAQTFAAVAGITALVLAVVTRERRLAERAVREIATTLEQSLVPARLPRVPEIESATYFRAAGDGRGVGGDFYDLFRVADRRWALTIGDVCGKGVPAAAQTAMARHTLRAASLRESLPSRVLAALNEAARRHESDVGAMCTASYATIDLNGSSAIVHVSSAGHPLPLLVRADGTVTQFGEQGQLLGVYPDPTLADDSVELRAGETLLFYTDGLTDAYAPQRVIRISELQAVLGACADRTPSQTLTAIQRELLQSEDFEPRDDIAIVALQLTADERRTARRSDAGPRANGKVHVREPDARVRSTRGLLLLGMAKQAVAAALRKLSPERRRPGRVHEADRGSVVTRPHRTSRST